MSNRTERWHAGQTGTYHAIKKLTANPLHDKRSGAVYRQGCRLPLTINALLAREPFQQYRQKCRQIDPAVPGCYR